MLENSLQKSTKSVRGAANRPTITQSSLPDHHPVHKPHINPKTHLNLLKTPSYCHKKAIFQKTEASFFQSYLHTSLRRSTSLYHWRTE